MMVAELVSKSLLTATMGYLYWIHRERYLGMWTLGWLASSLYGVAILTVPPGWSGMSALGGGLVLGAAWAFLHGTHELAGRRTSRWWTLALGLAAGWAVAATVLELSFTPANLPVSFVLGAALIAVGWTLLRRSGVRGIEPAIAGGAFLLWGIHVLDYPFLRQVAWFAPTGFLISYALQIAGAIGMLVLYLRRSHEQLQLSQAQLAQSQKMEELGRLAGAVAHDFNNLLTVILGNLSLIDSDEETRERVAEADRASRRAADLTRQLLGFSRKQVAAPRILDLAAAVASVARMMERLVDSDVRLEVAGSEPHWIEADPGHVEQIILNLAINARDAMPDGGCLSLGTRSIELSEPVLRPGRSLPAGRYAVLEVRDDGVGIPEEALPHVFEAFYTTKREGEGTGLGLATVQQLVDQAQGAITVESEVGRGTTMRVFLPAVRPRVDVVDTAPEGDAGGSESILVAEDDPDLRALMVRSLTDRGYRVSEAGSGAAAEHALTTGRPLDLLITDVVMPDGSGPTLVETLRAIRPEVPVLMISGYTEGRMETIPTGCRFLAKPFTPQELAVVVRATLDARPAVVPGRSRPA